MSTWTDHLLQETGKGETLPAADQILIDPKPGTLTTKVEELLSTLKEKDWSLSGQKQHLCELLLRIGFNLVGRDTGAVGYSEAEVQESFDRLLEGLDDLEGDTARTGGSGMKETVAAILWDMKSVNGGDSLPGLLAERIKTAWPASEDRSPGRAFLVLLREELRRCVYWHMVAERCCKFGNDYARGLEYLRHIGFCQVSTNPVLAARAFEEDLSLVQEFKVVVKEHPEWMEDPERHRDPMAMAATLFALWPNLSVFRPLSLHTSLWDYMVSFQLNPNIADLAEESLIDARRAYQMATEFLTEYDRCLGLGARAGAIRPNMVFKVAGSSEASREITRALNADGIGTNNTVVYTVAQEVQLMLDAFEGKAMAIKAGKPVTRTYETNMGGRLVSHLREEEAEKIFRQAVEGLSEARATAHLMDLAQALSVEKEVLEEIAKAPFSEKARTICSFQYLKSLDHEIVLTAAKDAGLDPAPIVQQEEDLRKAGTLVARRVYRVFYSPENCPRWIDYFQRTYSLTPDQAEAVLSSMDVLPASKRIPEDTYHTLGTLNMCNTEFPNHARAVQLMSEKPGFRLEAFQNAIMDEYDPGVAQRLSALPDFRRAYDLTPELKELLLHKLGIEEVQDWGTEGIRPEDWSTFGSVQKTGAEFRAAYEAFAAKCVDMAREVAAARDR